MRISFTNDIPHTRAAPVPPDIIAVRVGGPNGRFLCRLLLPAGRSNDEIAHNLLSFFPDAAGAQRLIAGDTAVRGLPSEGNFVSEEEQELLFELPREFASLEKLDEFTAEFTPYNELNLVFAFDGEWMVLGAGRDAPVKLQSVKLFRLRLASR